MTGRACVAAQPEVELPILSSLEPDEIIRDTEIPRCRLLLLNIILEQTQCIALLVKQKVIRKGKDKKVKSDF